MSPLLRKILFALLAIATPSVSSAQTVTGVVVDSASQEPLQGATAVLADAAGKVVNVAVSNAAGHFTVRATEAGLYLVTFKMIGFDTLTSPVLQLRVGKTVQLSVGMSHFSHFIDTVVVHATGGALSKVTAGHEIFREHYVLGLGQFESGWDIERSKQTLSDYLAQHVKGLILAPRATEDVGVPMVPAVKNMALVSANKPRCLYARIDRMSLPRIMAMQQEATIDAVLPVEAIMAVEYYKDAAESPDEWHADVLNPPLVLFRPASIGAQYDSNGNAGGAMRGVPARGMLIGDLGFMPLFHEPAQSFIAPPDPNRGAIGATNFGGNSAIVEGIDSLMVGSDVLIPFRGVDMSHPGAKGGTVLNGSEFRQGGPSCGLLQIWTHAAW